jgi:hypothetical protein
MDQRDALRRFVAQRFRGVLPMASQPWATPPMQSGVTFVPSDGSERWTTDAVELAELLFAETEFRSLRLAQWLQTPEGQVVEVLVGELLPGLDYRLVVEALRLAAQMQQRQETRQMAGLIAVGALICLAALFFASGQATGDAA